MRRTLAAFKFKPVIGLEVHAQLSTAQKLFSPSPHRASAPENTLLSPYDTSIPGSLPILNLECVEKAVVAASALNCVLNDESRFERKHYFYPDLPSGYQVTQNRWPIAGRGALPFGNNNKSSEINRIQLETDTGKSTTQENDESDDIQVGSAVNIDYNRAGAPLIEIVFEPDIGRNEGQLARSGNASSVFCHFNTYSSLRSSSQSPLRTLARPCPLCSAS